MSLEYENVFLTKKPIDKEQLIVLHLDRGWGDIYTYKGKIIKVFRPDNIDRLEKRYRFFKREAFYGMQLNCEYIVKTLDAYTTEIDGINFPVIEIEYIDGQLLSEVILENNLSWQQKIQFLQELTQALNYIHQQGLVSRSIKSENTMIRNNKICLFDNGNLMTVGTESGAYNPYYRAPDIQSGSIANPKDDIFALGVIFAEMLANVGPFRARSCDWYSTRLAKIDNYRDKIIDKNIPESLLELINSMTHRELDQRPLCGEIIDELKQLS